MKHYDVMVIDDEQVVLDAVNRICAAEEYQVDICLEVPGALERIKHNGYRLVLCDLMLPDIDGFGFLDMLVREKIDIPVIMMTGFSTMENAVKSLNKGAIDFMPKPFTADELCSAIKRGLMYVDIRDSERNKRGKELSFVPCPPKYSRLGYVAWISKDNRGTVLIGATDLFLKTIQSVKKVDLMDVENELIQGSYCASILSETDIQHPLLAPLSGRILEKNQEIFKNSSLLEKDPYFAGWLYRIIPSDLEFEMQHLVSCRVEML